MNKLRFKMEMGHNIKLILLLITAVCTTAYSQTKSQRKNIMQNDDDKSKIIEVSRQLSELMIKRDTSAINKIVDPAFTLMHITGYVQPKAEWFAEIETESMKYYSYKEVKTSVDINGDKATFVGQNLLDARIWGTRNTWRLQQRMTLEKRGGNWIILKSIATTF